MKTIRTFPGQRVALGHQGENLALTVIFSIGAWVDAYGPGTVHLAHMRNGDPEAYPVAVTQVGTEVSWEVSDADTAVDGYGKYELRYIVGETVVKSSVGETYVRKALQYGAEPPEPVQSWLDHITEKEHGLLEAAENAEASAREAAAQAAAADAFALEAAESAQWASAMATGAQNAAEDAVAQADLSAKSAIAAGASADEAKAAADAAVEAVKNADFVKTVNGQTPDESGNVQIEVGRGSGVDVTAIPGQLIRVQSVDENGKPTAWEPVPWGWVEGETTHPIPGKLLPEGVPYVEQGEAVEILPETTLTFVDGQAFVIPTGEMSLGETYIVKYNGTEYECTTMLGEGYMFGNFAALGMADTGEPFVGIYDPAGTMEEDAVVLFIPLDGATEATVAISYKQKTFHKLDKGCLPDGVPNNILVVSTNGTTASHTGVEILSQCMSGKAVFMTYGYSTLLLYEVTDEGVAKFGNAYYDYPNGDHHYVYVVVEADGTISDKGFVTT